MPRPQPALLAALASAALLLPASGCYRYDARANNLTGHEVRVSINKGTRQREVSAAEIENGGSLGWTGSFNGPVVMKVASGGETVVVGLPRRAHTVVDVATVDGKLTVTKTVGDKTWTLNAGCGEECEGACCTDADEASETEGQETESPEKVDLVEPDHR